MPCPDMEYNKPRIVAKKRIKPKPVDLKAGPHNGDGRPDLRFPDPITGEMIGGQVGAMRMAMRYRHTVYPWARRQGKTKFRQFLAVNEATITPGRYFYGITYPDHTTAFKVAKDFIDSWGPMVKAYKNNDKDQDRWIELHPQAPPDGAPPPAWFTPRMAHQWTRCQSGDRNTECKIYLWSTTHPFYRKIQGFPHHFDRVDHDECQESHPGTYGIVRPMIRDKNPKTGTVGRECFSGTPWVTGIGNAKFGRWWDIAGDPTSAGWFRMRIPDGANPFVPAVSESERRGMTEQEIRQTIYAEFLTGEGAVFSNIDRILVLPFLEQEDPSMDWIRDLRRKYAMPTMEWWVNKPVAPRGHVVLLSVDWARSPRGDWTALTVVDASTGDQLALLRWRGENFNEQLEVVLAIAEHYQSDQNHADANGMGESMADFMRRRGNRGFVGHKFGRNKADYVRRLQILFREETIRMIDCAPQREEFKGFAAHETESVSSEKRITYAAAIGDHDDLVAVMLHLAPTLTITGRQEVMKEEEPPEPLFNKAGETTLEGWAEDNDMQVPWDDEPDDDEKTWQDVVLPRRYG